MRSKPNILTIRDFPVQCVLTLAIALWVVMPLVQFTLVIDHDDAQAEWVFDCNEDERGGEEESESDKVDDEEKSHTTGQLARENASRVSTSRSVRLKEALCESPIIDPLIQPPRV